MDSVGKVHFLHELVQSSVHTFLNELVQFIVHNSKFWTRSSQFQKWTSSKFFLFSICCYELLFFKIIATAHIEPQTAIILSVLTLKLYIKCKICLDSQLECLLIFLFACTYLERLLEFNVPFQVCCWCNWCAELFFEKRRAKFAQKCKIFPTGILTELLIKLF